MKEERSPDETLSALLPDDRRRMFTYIFQLPDHIPYVHKSTLTIETGGRIADSNWHVDAHAFIEDKVSPQPLSMEASWVSLRFWQANVERPLAPDPEPVMRVLRALYPSGDPTKAEGEPPSFDAETSVTVVEAVTPASAEEGYEHENLVADCFERCLSAVNRVIDAYSVAHNDPHVARISARHLGMFAMILSRPAEDVEFDVPPAFYLLPFAPRPDKEPLDFEGMELVTHFVAADIVGQPFTSGERFYHLASGALHRGDYDSAVVLAATAGEVTLNALLVALLVDAGEIDEAKDVFAVQPGLKARLRSRYAPLLGGRWNPDQSASEVGRWWSDVEEIRARILHGGYRATPQEAHDALVAAEQLDQYIDGQLAARAIKYPRTVLSKLGMSGLQARGQYTKRIKKAAEGSYDAPAFWGEVKSVQAEAMSRPPHRGAPPSPKPRWLATLRASVNWLLRR